VFTPLIGADEAAGLAAPVAALTASEQTAADALLAQHGKAALARCRMYVDKDASAAAILGTVEYLVSKGADVNAKDKYGSTPLCSSASRSNPLLITSKK